MTAVETTAEAPADTQKSREDRFIDTLDALREQPGQMAKLRRGLGKPPGSAAEMHSIILPFLGAADSQRDEWDENRFYLIASLFAFWHQGKSGRITAAPNNLGASLSSLKHESDSIEKRFIALLNCHRDDLSQHLRHAVGLLKSHDIGINWVRLLKDVKGWNWESRSVQRDWARGFWQRADDDEVNDSEP